MTSIMEQNVGTLTSLSGATNLNSLPEGWARPTGYVSFAANEYPNAKFVVTVNFSGVSPIDGGSINFYLLASLDAVTWSGNINPSGTTDVSPYLGACKEVVSIPVENIHSDTTLVYVCNDLAKIVGDLPEYWGLIVQNGAGTTLPASGHTLQYQSVSYEA